MTARRGARRRPTGLLLPLPALLEPRAGSRLPGRSRSGQRGRGPGRGRGASPGAPRCQCRARGLPTSGGHCGRRACWESISPNWTTSTLIWPRSASISKPCSICSNDRKPTFWKSSTSRVSWPTFANVSASQPRPHRRMSPRIASGSRRWRPPDRLSHLVHGSTCVTAW